MNETPEFDFRAEIQKLKDKFNRRAALMAACDINYQNGIGPITRAEAWGRWSQLEAQNFGSDEWKQGIHGIVDFMDKAGYGVRLIK